MSLCVAVCVFVLKQNYFMAFALDKHTDTNAVRRFRQPKALSTVSQSLRQPLKLRLRKGPRPKALPSGAIFQPLGTPFVWTQALKLIKFVACQWKRHSIKRRSTSEKVLLKAHTERTGTSAYRNK